MYEGHNVGVVVPVYNEAAFVGEVIDGLPSFVDAAYAVDDCSTDGSWGVVLEQAVRGSADGFAHPQAPDTLSEISAPGAPAAASIVDVPAPVDDGSVWTAGSGPDTSLAGEGSETVDAVDGPDASAAVDGPDSSGGVETQRASDGGPDSGTRVVPIRHETNRGRGAAVTTGYEAALADEMDVVAVLDGDGQMDPAELDRLIDPIVAGAADYTKGDRLRDPEDREEMSRWRLFGNAMLTLLTRVSSGYWGMSDPQNGYTAISRSTLEDLRLDGLYEDYGFLNDVLVQLNVAGARVVDVSMRARYGEEESGIEYQSFVPRLSWLLCRRFVWRLRVADRSSRRRPVGLLYGLAALTAVGGLTGSVLSVGTGADGLAPVALGGLLASFALAALAVTVDRRDNRPLVSRRDLDRPLE